MGIQGRYSKTVILLLLRTEIDPFGQCLGHPEKREFYWQRILLRPRDDERVLDNTEGKVYAEVVKLPHEEVKGSRRQGGYSQRFQNGLGIAPDTGELSDFVVSFR